MEGILSTEMQTVVEPTVEEWERRKKEAGDLINQVRTALLAGRAADWAVAEALWQFDQKQAWQALEYDTLNEFLADPEVGISRSAYYRYISVYNELVVRRELSVEELLDVDISKADTVLAAIRDSRVAVDVAVSDARTLGRRDLREKYAIPQRTSTPGVPPAGQDDEPTNGAAVTVDDSPVVAADVGVEEVVEDDDDDTDYTPPADDAAFEPPAEISSQMAQAIVDLKTAFEGNAGFPRLSRQTVVTLLSFFDDSFRG